VNGVASVGYMHHNIGRFTLYQLLYADILKELLDIMSRTDAYPRAKALVQAAALVNLRLTGADAYRMLEARQEREQIEVAKGEILAQPGLIPLEIPASPTTPKRWINQLPPFQPWDADTASPQEFQVIARVFRELTDMKILNRAFSQVEADKIARYGMIVPTLTAKELWAVSHIAAVTEANNLPMDAFNTWLMFMVPPMTGYNSETYKDWMGIYRKLGDEGNRKFPYVEFTKGVRVNMLDANGCLDGDLSLLSVSKGSQ